MEKKWSRNKLGIFDITLIQPADVDVYKSLIINISKQGSIAALLITVAILAVMFSTGFNQHEYFFCFIILLAAFVALQSLLPEIKSAFNKPYLTVNSEGICFRKALYTWQQIKNIKIEQSMARHFSIDMHIELAAREIITIELPEMKLNASVAEIAACVNQYIIK